MRHRVSWRNDAGAAAWHHRHGGGFGPVPPMHIWWALCRASVNQTLPNTRTNIKLRYASSVYRPRKVRQSFLCLLFALAVYSCLLTTTAAKWPCACFLKRCPSWCTMPRVIYRQARCTAWEERTKNTHTIEQGTLVTSATIFRRHAWSRNQRCTLSLQKHRLE